MLRNLLLFTFFTISLHAENWTLQQQELAQVIDRFDAQAKLTKEKRQFTYRYRTQNFKVHVRYKTGHYSSKAFDQEGPQADGFMVRLSYQPGEYQGAAMLPQTITGPYWNTYVNSYPVAGGHLHYSVAYGSRSNRRFLKDLLFCFSDLASNNPYQWREELSYTKKASRWVTLCKHLQEQEAHIDPQTPKAYMINVVEAFARVVKKVPEAQLVMHGFFESPDYIQKIRDVIAREKMGDSVYMFGPMGGEEMAYRITQATVFANGSVDETFCMPLLEAQACGVPVVGFAAGGVPEVVAHEKTGLLADANDIEG